ncbi:MAG TPA: SMI1/KNR4 family protein [Polyangiaceae bacterium]|nr:SMI1/KNR4 family protein [Polyangiaceae bacterium]
MDSDLAESLQALKSAFEKRNITVQFGKGDPAVVDTLRKAFRVPSRYRTFLLEADPSKVETSTPVERVRLFRSAEIEREQIGFGLNEDGTPRATNKDGEWRKSWVVIAQSSLLGDPYFLDVSKLDAEGDCAVYTAMNGAGRWEARLCGSTFAQFLRILAAGMEVAQGFGEAIMDDEDEAAFREAFGHKIKTIDAAALRAGHWT